MQVAKNHFTDGLVMDLSSESTPNNCLTNALNATYVTMNGNELQGTVQGLGSLAYMGATPYTTAQIEGIFVTESQ